jgi:hypothetical protein
MRFLRRFFIRLSNFATGRRANQRLQDELANISRSRQTRICASECRPQRRGVRLHSNSARPQQYGKTTTPSIASPSSNISRRTCGTRFASARAIDKPPPSVRPCVFNALMLPHYADDASFCSKFAALRYNSRYKLSLRPVGF